MTDNIINLFKNKSSVSPELPLEDHINNFLNSLDSSLDSFHKLSAYEKYELYSCLISFTKTSMEAFLKMRGNDSV